MATFDYTSRDYYSIREDLLSRAAAMPIGAEWSTNSPSDFGVMLVDLWAYMGDVLHFYVDRAAAETYLNTATQRESVLAIANLLDYEPLAVNSARATVTLAPTVAPTGTINIPYGTQFVAPARNSEELTYYFVSTVSASMAASATSITIEVIEGQYVQNEAPVNGVATNANTSNGGPGQQFNLRYTNVVPTSVNVLVMEGPVISGSPTEVTYRYVPRLADYSSTDKVFTLTTDADNVTSIVFGNGVNGKIPNTGAEVYVDYIRSSGNAGNLEANRITSLGSNTNLNLYVVSSTASNGGYDPESLESLKANIPLLFRTQDRAVSLQDFKDLLLRVPGVVKATASNNGSDVTLYPVTYQDNYLSTTFGNSITISSGIAADTLTYFEPRTVVGASVGIAGSVSLTQVYISATINVLDGFVQRWVLDAATEVVDEFFTFDNVSFGQTLALGQIYRALMNVEGVDYVNITVFNTSNSGIASGNKITAAATNLLHKGAAYTFTMSGGVTG